MTSPSPQARHWRQLLALTFAHAVADTYVGIIAPVLIPMQDRYDLSLALLIFVVSLQGFAANVFQIPIGHFHPKWRRPTLISIGVLLSGLSVLIPCLPDTPHRVVWMSLLAVTAGFGVAAVHPEGLRALHSLSSIPASLTTAVFMVAGFAGFAGGALLSAALTEHFGLHSLLWLYALAPLAAATAFFSGLDLPTITEKDESDASQREKIPSLPFAPLFCMGTLLATCSQIQATLLPSYLHKEAGYSLTFSGLSFTLFGLGGMIGAIIWGMLAPRLGHLRVLFLTALCGAPLTAVYLLSAPHSKTAAAILTFTGFIVYTGFPLCITLARYASSSLRFGIRMGLISGGSWAIAAVVLWGLGPLADHTGFAPLLHLIWLGYLAAAFMALWLTRRQPARKLPNADA